MSSLKIYLARLLARLTNLFGRGLVVSMGVILATGLGISLAAFIFMNAAVSDTITVASGPAGSSFQRYAERYRKILAKEGIKVVIVPSTGSPDNLRKLNDPKVHVDVGFVLGGEVGNTDISGLQSLGSISYQPLMVFYRGQPKALISDFRGMRLDIGPDGTGAHTLALALFKASNVDLKEVTLMDASASPVQALLDGRIDAAFLMSDSTSTETMRKLLREPDVHLFDVAQADAYARRINYLNKLELPRGSLDLGLDIPARDISLIGPTVELVARKSLHPALSDLLLEAAREAHGNPGLLKKRGEFPAALEHEIPMSPDALRWYSSGKSFLYRNLPFWMASMVARVLAVILPIILLLIPALKFAPAIYRWRMESRIYRWYRALLELEREALDAGDDPARRAEALRRLDHIEHAVNRITVPASFGDLFYGLRSHIGLVRKSLLAGIRRAEPVGVAEETD